jgi:hypothetical protein
MAESLTTQNDESKQDWIERCAQRYIDVAKIDPSLAREFAESLWENRTDDSDSPEAAADEDMSHWERG